MNMILYPVHDRIAFIIHLTLQVRHQPRLIAGSQPKYEVTSFAA